MYTSNPGRRIGGLEFALGGRSLPCDRSKYSSMPKVVPYDAAFSQLVEEEGLLDKVHFFIQAVRHCETVNKRRDIFMTVCFIRETSP
jgi:hypothetical protein